MNKLVKAYARIEQTIDRALGDIPRGINEIPSRDSVGPGVGCALGSPAINKECGHIQCQRTSRDTEYSWELIHGGVRVVIIACFPAIVSGVGTLSRVTELAQR